MGYEEKMIVSAGRTAQQCLQVLGHLHIFLEKKFKLNSGAPGRQREGGKEARRLVSRVLFFDWVGVGFMGV